MKQSRTEDGERTLAVFIDFENLALGFHDRRDRFQIDKVLARLVEKGKIVAKKAYADWSRFGAYAGSLHECAIELIEIPKRSMTGKNSADIRLVVDAIDLAYSKEHIDTIVVVSGDSDFSPLVSKLKELGKHVIGLGLQDATSHLLRDNCDEFIYYEDLDRPSTIPLTDNSAVPESKKKMFSLLLDSLLALRRENKETIYSSMVKDTMKRKRPSFNEEYFGYRTFQDLLEDAQRYGLVEIQKHPTSGTYVVTRFGGEMRMPITSLPQPKPTLALPPRPALEQDRSQDRGRHQPQQQQRPPQQQQQSAPQGQGKPPFTSPVYRPPVKPVAPPPVISPVPANLDDETPPVLGRSLMEEIDDFDDEIPSYSPGKKKLEEPSDAKKPVGKQPVVKKPPRTGDPAKPRASAKPKSDVEPKPAPKPRAEASRPAATKPPAPKPAPPLSVAKPVPKPKPVEEDDGFGAGLDE